MTHHPADSRFVADLGGTQGHFLFSFGHYFDPDNLGLGPLRAFNDVSLAPRVAGPLHPHVEVEIVTVVLSGTLTYADQTQNLRDVPAANVLRLTAGTGTQHAESNRGTVPARALELWFRPGQAGLQPSQEQKRLDLHTPNRWTPLVSGRGDGGGEAVFLNCDATVWWANLAPGASLAFAPDAAAGARSLLVYVVSGAATGNGQPLAPGDQVRLSNERLTLGSATGAQMVVVDVPE